MALGQTPISSLVIFFRLAHRTLCPCARTCVMACWRCHAVRAMLFVTAGLTRLVKGRTRWDLERTRPAAWGAGLGGISWPTARRPRCGMGRVVSSVLGREQSNTGRSLSCQIEVQRESTGQSVERACSNLGKLHTVGSFVEALALSGERGSNLAGAARGGRYVR